jgi:hypothetical protein
MFLESIQSRGLTAAIWLFAGVWRTALGVAADTFMTALAQHRHFDRDTDPPLV